MVNKGGRKNLAYGYLHRQRIRTTYRRRLIRAWDACRPISLAAIIRGSFETTSVSSITRSAYLTQHFHSIMQERKCSSASFRRSGQGALFHAWPLQIRGTPPSYRLLNSSKSWQCWGTWDTVQIWLSTVCYSASEGRHCLHSMVMVAPNAIHSGRQSN